MPTKKNILLIIAILIVSLSIVLIALKNLTTNNFVSENNYNKNTTSKITDPEWRMAADLSNAKFENLTEQKIYLFEKKEIIFYSGWITNPTTKDKQNVHLYFPKDKTDLPFVVLVPGGSNDGTEFEKTKGSDSNTNAIKLAATDFIVAVYSPLGLGESAGQINYQGFDDQDGLAAIVAAGKKLNNVDPKNIGLASFSYGITGATGVLARYPDLNIKFFSDWEGPTSRSFTTVGCQYNGQPPTEPKPGAFSCRDEEHWTEREAINFIKSANVKYYWRIQRITDHVQKTYGHTLEIMQAAVGNIPWVKLNDDKANTEYTTETDLPLAEDNQDYFGVFVLPHLKQMAEME